MWVFLLIGAVIYLLAMMVVFAYEPPPERWEVALGFFMAFWAGILMGLVAYSMTW